MSAQRFFSIDSGVNGVLLAIEPGVSESAESLIGRCVKICLSNVARSIAIGFYGAIECGSFEGHALSFRDNGPREFAANFPSLWMHSAVNQSERSGPVLVYGDSDHGLYHAMLRAHSDISAGLVECAIIVGLHRPGIALGFAVTSAPWLNETALEICDKESFLYLSQLLVGQM